MLTINNVQIPGHLRVDGDIKREADGVPVDGTLTVEYYNGLGTSLILITIQDAYFPGGGRVQVAADAAEFIAALQRSTLTR